MRGARQKYMKAAKLDRKIALILLCMLFLPVISSSCGADFPYYQMDHFTDEQASKIKSAFGITGACNVTLISLTEDSPWHDVCLVLIFTVKRSDWGIFNNNLPTEFKNIYVTPSNDWPKATHIVFNGISYYLSRRIGGERYNLLSEYFPADGNGDILYSYSNYSYGLNIHGMAERFGKEVKRFPEISIPDL